MRLGKVTGTRKICSVKMVFKTAHQNSPWTCKGCRVDAWLGYEKYWKTSEKTFSNPRNGVPAKSVRSDRKIEIWKTSLKPLTLKDKVFNPELNTTPLSLTKNYSDTVAEFKIPFEIENKLLIFPPINWGFLSQNEFGNSITTVFGHTIIQLPKVRFCSTFSQHILRDFWTS